MKQDKLTLPWRSFDDELPPDNKRVFLAGGKYPPGYDKPSERHEDRSHWLPRSDMPLPEGISKPRKPAQPKKDVPTKKKAPTKKAPVKKTVPKEVPKIKPLPKKKTRTV